MLNSKYTYKTSNKAVLTSGWYYEHHSLSTLTKNISMSLMWELADVSINRLWETD